MKNYILFVFALIVVTSCDTETDNNTSNELETTENAMQLRHVVLFKFKEEATSADIQKIEAAFIELPSKIKEIKGFEWGINNSPEGLNKDFTHCFLVTFNSEEERSIYLPHAAHKAFVDVLTPHLEDVLVLDYWAK